MKGRRFDEGIVNGLIVIYFNDEIEVVNT